MNVSEATQKIFDNARESAHECVKAVNAMYDIGPKDENRDINIARKTTDKLCSTNTPISSILTFGLVVDYSDGSSVDPEDFENHVYADIVETLNAGITLSVNGKVGLKVIRFAPVHSVSTLLLTTSTYSDSIQVVYVRKILENLEKDYNDDLPCGVKKVNIVHMLTSPLTYFTVQ